MELIKWKKDFSVGVKEIDDQHKKLILSINETYNLFNKSASREEMGKIIQSMIEFSAHHFDTEEKYFKMYNFKDAKEHIFEHDKIKKQLLDFMKKYERGKVDVSVEFLVFLNDWLHDHLIMFDKEYIECFKEAGLK